MTYEPTGLSLEIFRSRHAAHSNETWAEASDRVAVHVSNAETGEARNVWRDKYRAVLQDNTLMPGGRIWYGSGRARGQLLNCVSGDTLVHTRAGRVPARVLAGLTVDTLSVGGIYRAATWAAFGTQELFTITFENGDTVEATEGHQWLVTQSGSRPDVRVTTAKLEGRLVPMQHLMPSARELDNEQFRAGVRHGLVYGDGTVNHTGKASITQFQDSAHLIPDYFDKSSVQYHARYPEGVTYAGALDPALKTSMPTVPTHGHSYVFGFLAGYIAADGNVDSRGSVALHSAKREDLVTARGLAADVGLPSTSITLARALNPWNGEPAALYCLRFAKSGIDPRLILRRSHREYMADAPTAGKRTTMRVVSVRSTGRHETVYCCNEPQTHTWVANDGYLTSNCFVIDTSDSREGWAKTVGDSIIISGTGGGVGINFSPTRPRGSAIRGTGGTATGAVSEMEMVNAVGDVIKAGGGRRTALMFALSLSHPDVIEFMDKKLDRGELNNANVSVVFDEDPEDFFALVQDGAEFPLTHQGRQVGSIPADVLWRRIVENAVKPREGGGGGEPGLLNGYLANRMSNIWYVEPLTCTNPCGEIWLSPDDCCCLSALVLPRFVKNGKVQWDLLRDVTATGIRFLDDVLSVNQYPLPQIQAKCSRLRRVGLGITGLHHMLLELGLGYNEPAGLEFVNKLMNAIKNASYEASADLAAEKGSFPAFDSDKFLKGNFVKQLKPTLRAKIAKQGMRNCAVNTIAPVGTGSMVCDVSSGIEPIFAVAHERRFRRNETLAKEVVLDPMFARFHAEGRSTDHFLGAHEISVRDHFEMQRVCQRHVDNAVSKTINLPANTSPDELAALYVEYLPELKGVTVYPDGSREDQPLTPLSRADAVRLAAEAVVNASGEDKCRTGSCDI